MLCKELLPRKASMFRVKFSPEKTLMLGVNFFLKKGLHMLCDKFLPTKAYMLRVKFVLKKAPHGKS